MPGVLGEPSSVDNRARRAVYLTTAATALPLLVVLSPAALAAHGAPPSAGSNARVHLHDAHGVHVDAVKRIGMRQLQATITPTALGRPIGVRIILPRHYQPHPRRRYPTLYLFPGTSGDSTNWSQLGHAQRTTRPYRLITVSSDIGFNDDGGSWFTNWVDRHTPLGKSQWERYDIHQLIPWIDANFATIRNRDGRAVAGLSQGGYGAAELATRDPDLFTMMGSFSGAPEIDRDLDVRVGAAAVIDATMVGLNYVEPDAPFGDHVTDETNWEGHDPARMLGNLRHTALWLATADGAPGKYDDPVTDPAGVVLAGGVESLTHVSTDAFIQHLKAANISYVDYDYGSGTHSWPYWARDLRRFIHPLMHRFAHPPRRAKRVYYKSIQSRWTEYGWHVRLHRNRVAFTTLRTADRHGFRISGVGRAIVRTPATYQPKHGYNVRIGKARETLRADRHGRLRISVPIAETPTKVTIAG